MSLANRSFKNNKTGDVIKVIDSFENISVLENKQKIDTRVLMDPNQYTEQIDPASFFNNQGAYNILAEKIKNIPTDKLMDDTSELTNRVTVNLENNALRPSMEESAIVYSSEEDEKAELAKKYGASMPSADSITRQNEAFAKILGDDDTEIQQISINRDIPTQQLAQRPVYNEPVQRVEVEDPIIKMFKGVKRNVDFNISIDINNKIPRLDFIEMMEDSYETSIIEFLADEFTREIVTNPGKIKSMISEKIKSMLASKSTNSQITDSVTQVNDSTGEVKIEKSKTTRKSKKESTKND